MNKVSGKIQAKSRPTTPLPHVQKSGFAARPFPTQVTQEAESQTIQGKEIRGNHRVIAPAPAVGMLANVNRAIATDSTTEPAGTGMTVQAKLTIGAPGDKYEQEADRVAKQVVQRLQAPATPPVASPSGEGSEPTVQRQVAIPIMQRVTAGLGGSTSPMPADAGFEAQLQRSRSGGSPLDAAFRAKVEPLMGADFSGVRVHTDGNSDRLARSIQAKAFTTGMDMYFSSGAYEPGSRGGQELLAHELTHVVQQKANPAPKDSEEGKDMPHTAPRLTPIHTTKNAGERVQAVLSNYAYEFAWDFESNEEITSQHLNVGFQDQNQPSVILRNNLYLAFEEYNDQFGQYPERFPNGRPIDFRRLNNYPDGEIDHQALFIENQAHHIVEVNDSGAHISRDILEWADIDINAAINGVILPALQNHPESEALTTHNGSHVAEYSQLVEESLFVGLHRSGILNDYWNRNNERTAPWVVGSILADIREMLIDNPIRINRNGDPEIILDPNGNEVRPIPMRDYFVRYGLVDPDIFDPYNEEIYDNDQGDNNDDEQQSDESEDEHDTNEQQSDESEDEHDTNEQQSDDNDSNNDTEPDNPLVFGSRSHNIVEATEAAMRTRNLLLWCGIDLDSEENTITLDAVNYPGFPTNILYLGPHNTQFSHCVTIALDPHMSRMPSPPDILQGAAHQSTKDAVIETLENIKNMLSTSEVQIYKMRNEDNYVDDETGRTPGPLNAHHPGDIWWQLFEQAGLLCRCNSHA